MFIENSNYKSVQVPISSFFILGVFRIKTPMLKTENPLLEIKKPLA
jgi:hypothetical protein